MAKFTNKIIVVTGGAKGIGRAVAEAFAGEGAHIALMSRTYSELENTKKAIEALGTKCLIQTGDVSNESDVLTFFTKVEKELGAPDVLVNNAAILKAAPVESMDYKDWTDVMAVNVGGVFLCSRAFFRIASKNKRGGSIINVSSLAGIRGTDKFPGFSSYVASKFAVTGLTESLALEGKSIGVRVNCIAPGAVNTDLLRRAAPHLKSETEPKDIAGTVLFLANDKEAAKLTGSVIEIFSNAS